MNESQYLKRVLSYIVKEWKLLTTVVLFTVLSTFIGLTVPVLVREAINGLVLERFKNLLPYALGIIALTALRGMVSFGQNYYSEYLSQKIIFRIRNELYRHLQNLSFSFYDKIDTGQIIARATGDVNSIRFFIRFFSRGLVDSVIMIVSALLVMLSVSHELALVALVIAPIITAIIIWYGRNIRPLAEKRRYAFGELNSHLQETIVGIKILKALASETFSFRRFIPKCKEYFDISIEMGKLRAIVWPLISFIVGVDVLIVYWYGGMRVTEGTLTIGDLVAFTMYLNMLMWPMVSLGFFTSIYQRAIVAARRVFEILDMEPEVKEKPNAIELKNVKGHIKLENVWFSYDGKHWVLKDINLEVKPGEKVAIVGAVGCGKSTLIKLIPRFYDPQKGRVLIDGVDVRDVKISSLRRNIGIVHQDIFIFPDTIRNNIAFGKPNATLEEIEKAAKVAKIHDFIISLPKKYDTLVGERGITLSGGQRQRLAIARAIILNPKIIILDDSTSQVDVETEKEIYEALRVLVKDKTCIIITQRFSTLSLADRIVVMDEGRIVEEGTHEELLKRGKLYPRLYKTFLVPIKAVVKPR